MVIPDCAGAGISVSFKDVIMYHPWQRPGCRHEQLAQEMQTIKRAMNEALKFPSASRAVVQANLVFQGQNRGPLNLSPVHSEPKSWMSMVIGRGGNGCMSQCVPYSCLQPNAVFAETRPRLGLV